MKRTICGVGKNDADYRINTKHEDGTISSCPIYQKWASMVGGLYSKATLERNAKRLGEDPSYRPAIVSDSWLGSFMSFREWMLANHRPNTKIDRRILGNPDQTNIYSADTCLCISLQLYGFIKPRSLARHIRTETDSDGNVKYHVYCSDPSGRNKSYIGCCDTEATAIGSWMDVKLEYAYQFKPELDKIDPAHFEKLLNLVKTMI